MGYQCLTFLTDYGVEDGFVASCHGVAARICPDVRIIDITHLVPPGDVRRGASVLAQTVPYLPPGVHVAVVDPGVGTARRGIAVDTGDRVFVGPDNGLLSWAVDTAASGRPVHAYELSNTDLWLEPVSATFHGRDIFTPVAARLVNGLPLPEVGDAVDDLVTLPSPLRRLHGDVVECEVLTVDRFGNVQLSITGADVEQLGVRTGGTLLLTLGRHKLSVPYGRTFGSVAPGELVAYADSMGCVALAVNSGNAAQRLGLPPGARVRIAVGP